MGNAMDTWCGNSKESSNTIARTRCTSKDAASSPANLMPLLESLEEAFKEHCNKFEEISPDKLIALWVACVEEDLGEISAEDRQLISESVDHFSITMDIDNNGMISYTEFMTYALGGLRTRGVFGNLRDKLKTAIDQDPEVLSTILERFKMADKDANGYIDKDELAEVFTSMASTVNHMISNPAELALEYMHEMDLDGDGKVDFYEFLSYQLGRRKQPVELLLYDISSGLSKNLSWLLIGKQFEAIYHTGVVCFGTEYWFGGSIFQNEPPMKGYFGNPLSESVIGLQESEHTCLKQQGFKVVRLGYTMYTKQEALRFLNRTLAKKYTHATYDVLSHNCNHFSDDFVYFLTGNHISADIRDLPQIAMQTPTAQLLRPMLNAYLGGFGADGDSGTQIRPGANAEAPKLEDLLMDDGALDAISGLEINPQKCDATYPSDEPVLAKVIKLYPNEDNHRLVGYMDVRFYDPTVGKVVTMCKVPMKQLEESLLYFDLSSGGKARRRALAVPLTAIAHTRLGISANPATPTKASGATCGIENVSHHSANTGSTDPLPISAATTVSSEARSSARTDPAPGKDSVQTDPTPYSTAMTTGLDARCSAQTDPTPGSAAVIGNIRAPGSAQTDPTPSSAAIIGNIRAPGSAQTDPTPSSAAITDSTDARCSAQTDHTAASPATDPRTTVPTATVADASCCPECDVPTAQEHKDEREPSVGTRGSWCSKRRTQKAASSARGFRVSVGAA